MYIKGFIRTIFILSAGQLLFSSTVLAQKKPYTEEVTVTAPYQPSISDANKINLNPEINDTTLPKPEFKYSILSRQIPTSFTPEPLEAARMTGEPISKLYEHFLKLGIGNYYTPYGEYFYNNTRSKTWAYGLQAKHFSSKGSEGQNVDPQTNLNEINLFVKHFNDRRFNLNADMGYKREAVTYYGSDNNGVESLLPIYFDTRQHFSLFHINGGISSCIPDSSALGYKGKIGFYHLGDNYDSRENAVKLEGSVFKTQKLIELSPRQHWEIAGGFEYYHNATQLRPVSGASLFSITPSMSTKIEKIGLKIGLNTELEHESSSTIHLHPILELKMEVIPDYLRVSAGLTGMTERNSYLKFSNENPFVYTGVPTSFKNTKYEIYGGIASTFIQNLDFSLRLSTSKVENLPFYVNNTTIVNDGRFSVLYDEGANIFNLRTELSWHKLEKMKLMIRYNYYQFNTTSPILPWQTPENELTLSAAYNLADKILVNADFIYYSRMYALTYSHLGNPEELAIRDRPDFNLSGEYRYTKFLSFFLRLNNLASVRYYYWNNYPSYKFNFLGGLAFSF